MKKDTHPKEYREVVFQDTSTNDHFIGKSTVKTDKTIDVDGKEYPLYQMAISSFSHPFYTGARRLVDTAGRIDKFKKKYQR